MTWDEYSDRILKYCIYPDVGTGNELERSYLVLGLASEAGEVAGIMKKEIRDCPEEFNDDLWVAEIGDCLWYLTRLMSCLGYSIDEVMEYNLAKLESRWERSKIKGSGDYR